MNALEKVRTGGEFLRHAGIDRPLNDAELIVSHCLGTDRVTLYRDNPEIRDDTLSVIETFLRRRARREPLQYILGRTDFRGLTIRVGPGVLIPRPETELLVEEAIRIITEHDMHTSKLKILDLCTGSGCIALALAKEFPGAEVYGTDISDTAICCAEENARLNMIHNIRFLRGSFFEPFERMHDGQATETLFDLVVSNPPYIRTGYIGNLQPEIREWEPADALDGGEDGLDCYREIIPETKRYLKEGGFLMFEIGVDQADAVREVAMTKGYAGTSLRKDYAGIDRIITLWL
jgi:release factor glutamine methyltransferase